MLFKIQDKFSDLLLANSTQTQKRDEREVRQATWEVPECSSLKGDRVHTYCVPDSALGFLDGMANNTQTIPLLERSTVKERGNGITMNSLNCNLSSCFREKVWGLQKHGSGT
jgi:hypothetical protein